MDGGRSPIITEHNLFFEVKCRCGGAQGLVSNVEFIGRYNVYEHKEREDRWRKTQKTKSPE